MGERTLPAAVARCVLACAVASMAALGGAPTGVRAAVARPGSSPRPTPSLGPPVGVGTAPLDRQTVGGPALAGRGVVVDYPSAAAPRLPAVPASAYVVADAGTGAVLAAKDPHGEYLPASTLKVLTAVTLIPQLNPDATVTASQRAAQAPPSKVGLVAGQRYRISDLFKALLLVSANDAAIALAQATGSYARGIALMNAEAHHLQAYDITVKDPNGLNAPGQYVSAYDLALVARQALTMPAFMAYDSLRTARFPVTPHHWVTLYNQNYLLQDYPGGIGGKIGWTEKAGATYIGLARRNGVTLIVTILHCTPLTEVTYAERLLNWGFAMDGKVRPVGTLVSPLPTRSPAPPTPRARRVTVHPASRTRVQAASGDGTAIDSLLWVIGVVVLVAGTAAVIGLRRRRVRAD